MAQITSGVGLISGINTGAIINSLIAIDSAPITLLQGRIAGDQQQETAYSTLSSGLGSLQTIGNTLALPQTFQNAVTTSSDPNTLTATAAVGAAVGSYQFQVAQLVTTQQTISQGFADATSAPIGAGTITLEQGGGEANTQTPLSQLNGGAGVPPGQFRITDRSGNSAVINTSTDVTLDDVVNQINNSVDINVHATITDQGLVLSDLTGKTTSDLTVQDLGGGTTAKSLGISGDSTTGTITGSNINTIGPATALSQLNDGRGIRTTTAAQTDFTVTVGDGTQINVALSGDKSVGDVLNTINTAGGSKLKASVSASGTGITLTDTSGGGGGISIAAKNGSLAASDLGLTTAPSGNTIAGAPIIAGLDSVLVSSLKGGSGLPLGQINITDGAGHSGAIDLSGAVSVSDIINAINNNTSGVKVTASLNASQTGLQITDNSGGTGSLVIGDVNSTTAAKLGIAGTFSGGSVNGGNLQTQYISQNTLLSTYNGGQGVPLGQFQITNSKGAATTIDLTTGTYNTLGDIINTINAKNAGVTASINANGNGLLLTDTAGGANALKVNDLGGTTAADLNIVGTAATGSKTIDGALQKTITVTATDTLTTLQNKINQLGFGVTANTINDGSSADPYRLSITSVNSGLAGRVVIDDGTTNLNTRNLVNAQDAAVFVGGGGTASTPPLLVTSNQNTLTNLIKGVTISLVGASTTPVTLSITNSTDNVVQQLTNFVSGFNSLVNTITTDTQYDTTTNQAGVLLGDAATQQVQSTLYNAVDTVVNGAGKFKTLADIGITVGNGGQLTFDQNTFNAAFATNPTAVSNFFSQATGGLGNVIAGAAKRLTDPVNGILTLQVSTTNTQIQQFNDRINELNTILADKRTQLENQFNNMETVLAGLESQQAALGTINTLNTSSTSTANKTSSSSSSSSSTSTA
jgi:flagellar hook-associated protein 2